jgi:hypothetical protein
MKNVVLALALLISADPASGSRIRMAERVRRLPTEVGRIPIGP